MANGNLIEYHDPSGYIKVSFHTTSDSGEQWAWYWEISAPGNGDPLGYVHLRGLQGSTDGEHRHAAAYENLARGLEMVQAWVKQQMVSSQLGVDHGAGAGAPASLADGSDQLVGEQH